MQIICDAQMWCALRILWQGGLGQPIHSSWLSGWPWRCILISILNEGGEGAESQACACALNFTLIESVKACLRKDWYIQIYLCVGFLRPQGFSNKSTQVLVHEAPGNHGVTALQGHYFIRVFLRFGLGFPFTRGFDTAVFNRCIPLYV